MHRTQSIHPPEARAAYVSAPGHSNAEGRVGRKSPLLPILTALFVVALLVPALALGYNASHTGRVFRGVHVLGRDIGGLKRAEAAAVLSNVASTFSTSGLTVQGHGQSWDLTPQELGVAVDVERTLDNAVAYARGGEWYSDLSRQIAALVGGVQLNPVMTADAGKIISTVSRIAATVDKPAINSKLDQDGTGKVRITASTNGYAVDRAALASSITVALSTGMSEPVTLPVSAQEPKVTEAGLRGAQSQALLLTDQPVTLRSGKLQWVLQPADLRVMLTLDTPVEGAEPVALLDENAIAAYLSTIANKVQVDAKDAAVLIGKGTVSLKKEVIGAHLDVTATTAAVIVAANQADPSARVVDITLRDVTPGVVLGDVQPVYEKATALVNQGIRVAYGDDGYIMRGTSVTGFLDTAATGNSTAPLKLVANTDVLASRISGIAANINRSPADAQFRLVNGAPTKLSSGRDGLKVNVAGSVQNVKLAIASYSPPERLQVQLDVLVTPPNVKDADVSQIVTPDLLGSGQTSYVGSSAERAWNVGLGTRKVDGALIPPGGVFSTVDTIGDLTLDAGFKMGYAIMHTAKGITTVPAEAGGICQVATTLFHSVFWSGMPVVERNWHSYWIGTYGRPPSGMQGLDATIAPPYKDFRFRNTTGNWLLIRATADGKTVKFSLFGVNPGWKVTSTKPTITNKVATDHNPITEQSGELPLGKKVLVEHAQDGFDASITRIVSDSSGKVIDTWTAKSHYEPAHERYLVGTNPKLPGATTASAEKTPATPTPIAKP